MTIIEIELESAANFGEIEYGESRFAEIDNPLLEIMKGLSGIILRLGFNSPLF